MQHEQEEIRILCGITIRLSNSFLTILGLTGFIFVLDFRHLRELFQVDPADYMLAICGNDALRELSSPGKSGSFFYLTQDDRFMIKTVKKSEVKVSFGHLFYFFFLKANLRWHQWHN